MRIDREKYARFLSVVNTNYRKFRNKKFAYIILDDEVIYFRNFGFNDYEIIEIGELR